MKRRAFLRAGVAGVGAIAAGQAASVAAAPLRRIATTFETHRAVVIGSGFGGAIAAMHLGRAGVQTLVLERGIRWPVGPNANTFATIENLDHRASWLSSEVALIALPAGAPKLPLFTPYTGVMERVRGDGMDMICGAGVGGGSLIYNGTSLQPTEAGFYRTLPTSIDYSELDRDHFRRVQSMLHLATVPDDVLDSYQYRSSRQFQRRAAGAGLENFRVPLPLDWDYPRRELRGEMKAAYTTGDIQFGANNGGRYTVDTTYLRAAEQTGNVTVAVRHAVTDIARDSKGRWTIRVDCITTSGAVTARKVITAGSLFMGAGSPGTTRLLVKAKAKGLVTNLPDGVGRNWGNNGDRIFAIRSGGESWGAFQGGPTCVAARARNSDEDPLTITFGAAPIPVDVGISTVVAFGIVESRGHFTYNPSTDDTTLHWKKSYSARHNARAERVVRAMAREPGAVVVDAGAGDVSTYHPLGGATIGPVCDTYGRVHDQKGLYVVDGALIPGATGGCNPSMTIAALAERAMDDIVRRDVGTVI